MSSHAKKEITGDELYDTLTDNGLSAEEAAAIIQVEEE